MQKKLKNRLNTFLVEVKWSYVEILMIKSALTFRSKLLVNLSNHILNNGQFPDIWTEGIIILVHKQGSRLNTNNYRGITLSSCLGKLFCHVVNDRIVKMLDSKCFIKPEQTGFRKTFRTADHIFVVKTLVDKYVQKCKNCSKLYACYIDMKKAFDTVWHDALFLKLQKADISGKIYNPIKSMYSNSHSRV